MHVEQRDRCRPGEATPAWIRTESLYMPTRRKAEEMTVAELRRGLCPKSGGNWHACEGCQGKCSFGSRLAAIMRGEAREPETVENKPWTVRAPVPPQKSFDGRNRFSQERWKEVAEDITRRVEAGESFRAACAAHRVTDATVRKYYKNHGLPVPHNPRVAETREAARRIGADVKHRQAIHSTAVAMEARAQGMTRQDAAKAGGYTRWCNVMRIFSRHPQEVEAERERMKKA